MITLPPRVLATTLLAAATACSGAAPVDVLPGRSRPVLDHNWPHPRDLQLADSTFVRPDAAAALVTAAGGLRAYVLSSPDDGVVQIVAAVPFGRAVERPSEAGASDLLARLVIGGIDRRLDRTSGSRLQAEQDADLTRITLQTLPDSWEGALAAVVGGLRDLRFDPAAIDAYRAGPGFARPTRNLGGPTFRPAVELARISGGYPLAPAPPGVGVSAEAVRALASRALAPAAIVIGVGGGVDRGAAERALRAAAQGWTAPGAETVAVAPVAPLPSNAPAVLAIEEPGFTTWLALGHPVPAIASADEAAVAVLADVVNVRLNIAVREIRGLANQAVLQLPATTRHGGLLHIRSGARPESIAPILHYARHELSRVRTAEGRPTDDELEQVKGGLVLGRWQGSLDGARAASATYAVETVRYGSLDRLNAWPDAVRGVTAAAVQAAAVRYIDPERLGTVIIGQVEAARRARHPRWPFALDEVAGTGRRAGAVEAQPAAHGAAGGVRQVQVGAKKR